MGGESAHFTDYLAVSSFFISVVVVAEVVVSTVAAVVSTTVVSTVVDLVVSTSEETSFFSPQEETMVINPNDRASTLILNVVFIIIVGFRFLKIYLNAERMDR
jgi:hypothetical protein